MKNYNIVLKTITLRDPAVMSGFLLTATLILLNTDKYFYNAKLYQRDIIMARTLQNFGVPTDSGASTGTAYSTA